MPTLPGDVESAPLALTRSQVSAGSDAEQLAVFRMVRDSIEARVRDWLSGQASPASGD